jgi:hypothetical protein
MDLVECVSDRCGSALMPRPHWLRGNPSARSDILTRTPWLLAIGRMLRADYTEEEQLLPERLAALAKKLEGPSPGKGGHADSYGGGTRFGSRSSRRARYRFMQALRRVVARG